MISHYWDSSDEVSPNELEVGSTVWIMSPLPSDSGRTKQFSSTVNGEQNKPRNETPVIIIRHVPGSKEVRQ